MGTEVTAQILRGFLMGSADIVPGVSGGTVALVLGIYPRLVDAIATGARALGSLVRLDLRTAVRIAREIPWGFLIPLLGGIGLAVLTLAHVIDALLEEQPVRMAGAFFGLIVGSMIVVWRMLGRPDALRLAVLAGVAVVTFFVLGLRAGPVADPSTAIVLGAGMVAICAMILPGVSGSFLLVMLGMYDYVLDAVNERQIVVLIVFLIGAVVGLALFSNLLEWMLEHHERTVMAILIGLMVGSLRVLWPWPEGTAGTSIGTPSGDVVVPVLLAIACAALVAGLGLSAARRETPR